VLLLPELTLQLLLLRSGVLLLIVAAQGLAVAAAAVLLGDPGPRYDGRLTANPFAHLELFGGLALLLFGIGWGRPVAIDPGLLRGGRAGLVVPVLAGFAALLVTAAALRLAIVPALTGLPYTAGIPAAALLRVAALHCLASAVASLLPVPPLTGGLLAQAVGIALPPGIVRALSALLLVAAGAGLLRAVVAPVSAPLAGWLGL
jgi:hypothetical protein